VLGTLTEIFFLILILLRMEKRQGSPQYESWHIFEKEGEMCSRMGEVKKGIQYHIEYFNTSTSLSLSDWL